MWYQIRDRLYRRNNNDAGSSNDNRNGPKNYNVAGTTTNTMPDIRIASENISIQDKPDVPLPSTPEVLLISKNPLSEDLNRKNVSLSQALNPSKTPRSLKHPFDPFSTNFHSAASAETVIMPHAVNVPLSQEVIRSCIYK